MTPRVIVTSSPSRAISYGSAFVLSLSRRLAPDLARSLKARAVRPVMFATVVYANKPAGDVHARAVPD
jgi:hypothetical protein